MCICTDDKDRRITELHNGLSQIATTPNVRDLITAAQRQVRPVIRQETGGKPIVVDIYAFRFAGGGK